MIIVTLTLENNIIVSFWVELKNRVINFNLIWVLISSSIDVQIIFISVNLIVLLMNCLPNIHIVHGWSLKK